MTILAFTALFAGLGMAEACGNYFAAAVLVIGVFGGSTLWWLLLSGGVAFFKEKFNLRELKWVNRLSGILIYLFGLYVLLNLKLS
jgi:sulfite exporter TauE/SafE